MFIASCFNNYSIGFFQKGKFKKYKVTPPVGFEPAIPGFEATEQLPNRMRKENYRKRLTRIWVILPPLTIIIFRINRHYYRRRYHH